MKKSVAVTIALLGLVSILGCAEEDAKLTQPGVIDKTRVSRIRMFGQNGAAAILFRNSRCSSGVWGSGGEAVSGGFGSAFASFLGSVTNTSLGIAQTDTTRNLAKKDGMLSKAYYKELDIPPGKPSTLYMGFRDVSSFYVANGVRYESVSPSCQGAITFTPEAGKDYEAGFTWQGSTCRLAVNEVTSKDGQTELVPVPVTPAPDC